MCVFVSRPMKIVTFLWKNDYSPKRVVDSPRDRDTFRNKIMEIVEDFDEKSYNNNGKPWKSSRILRVNPIFFIFLSFFFLFSSFFSIFSFFYFFIFLFFIFFIFFIFSFFQFFNFFMFFARTCDWMGCFLEPFSGVRQCSRLGSVAVRACLTVKQLSTKQTS